MRKVARESERKTSFFSVRKNNKLIDYIDPCGIKTLNFKMNDHLHEHLQHSCCYEPTKKIYRLILDFKILFAACLRFICSHSLFIMKSRYLQTIYRANKTLLGVKCVHSFTHLMDSIFYASTI